MTDFKTTDDPFAGFAKFVGWTIIFCAITGAITIVNLIGRLIWGG